MKNKILTIIPAAGKPNNNIFPSYSLLPDCMVPINSKPVIGHIFDNLIERKITNCLLILNKNDKYTGKYTTTRYSKKLNLKIIYLEEHTFGLLGTINYGLNKIELNKFSSLFIYLGDTIYKGPLSFKKSFITVSNKYDISGKWCFIENKKFINKPQKYNGNGQIITGIYYLKDIKLAQQISSKLKSGELYELLEKYYKKHDFELIESKGWYDCGHIENYYQAKVDFLKIRAFNSIKYNPILGTVRKESKNTKKIEQEINWYINTPEKLKIFSPRLIDYKYGEHAFYEIEYYGYQSLGDIFVFSYFNEDVWKSIITKLLSVINEFSKFKTPLPYKFFDNMYITKTEERINTLTKDTFWKNLFNEEKIIINNKEYKNIKYFLNNIKKYTSILHKDKDSTFIHGDYCLSNILYDVNSGILRTIDPRGFFGETGVYGDIKYDLAKLRHSFCGLYDFIVSDLFNIDFNGKNNFNFKTYNDKLHESIGKDFDKKLEEMNYNLEEIKFIEALLFTTMIPLHSDNLERQKAMYCIAVKNFNSLNLEKLGK